MFLPVDGIIAWIIIGIIVGALVGEMVFGREIRITIGSMAVGLGVILVGLLVSIFLPEPAVPLLESIGCAGIGAVATLPSLRAILVEARIQA